MSEEDRVASSAVVGLVTATLVAWLLYFLGPPTPPDAATVGLGAYPIVALLTVFTAFTSAAWASFFIWFAR